MFKIIGHFAFTFAFASVSFSAEDTIQLKVVIQNGKFEPSVLKANANQKIELLVENKGPGAEEFESKELKREKVIPEGQSAKINLGRLKKGKYKFFGEFHEDTAQGTLEIE